MLLRRARDAGGEGHEGPKRHGGGGFGGGPRVVHVAEDAQPQWLQIPHGAARPVGAHVAADAQSSVAAAPSRRRPTCRRSRRCRRSTSPRHCPVTSLQINLAPSRRCPTCRRSRRWGGGRQNGSARIHRDQPVTLPQDAAPADARPLTALPDLSALTSLQRLNLRGCNSLTALPDLSALTSLKTLNLHDCILTALPDLSALTVWNGTTGHRSSQGRHTPGGRSGGRSMIRQNRHGWGRPPLTCRGDGVLYEAGRYGGPGQRAVR